MLEQFRSLVEEVEAGEKESAEPLRLEAVLKHYASGNKTVRRIHISERFNEREELDKYDRATEKGQRYCIVTIRLLPNANLAAHVK